MNVKIAETLRGLRKSRSITDVLADETTAAVAVAETEFVFDPHEAATKWESNEEVLRHLYPAYDAARAAAEWWANSGKVLDKTGDTSMDISFMAGKKKQLSDSERATLTKSLTAQILAAFITNAKFTHEGITFGTERVCFGVDYHPDEILKRAVEEACIKLEKGETLFPVKSACWVTFDSASVRPGYQQDPITLYKRES